MSAKRKYVDVPLKKLQYDPLCVCYDTRRHSGANNLRDS